MPEVAMKKCLIISLAIVGSLLPAVGRSQTLPLLSSEASSGSVALVGGDPQVFAPATPPKLEGVRVRGSKDSVAAIVDRLRQFTGPCIVTTERAAGAYGGNPKLFALIDSVDNARLVLRPMTETGLLGDDQVIPLDRVRKVEDLSSAAARMRTKRLVSGGVGVALGVATLIASLSWQISEPDPSEYPGPIGKLLYEADAKWADDARRSRTAMTILGVITLVAGGGVFVFETPLESKAAEWPSSMRP